MMILIFGIKPKVQFIRNHEGYLAIQNADDNINTIFIRGRAGEDGIKVIGDGAVELYHDNTKTFATMSHGAYLYGPEGGTANFYIYSDEGDDNADKWRIRNGDPAGSLTIQNYASGAWETSIECNGDGNVELYYDNDKKFNTDSGGAQVFGILRFDDGSSTTNHLNFGNSADLKIYHDGTHSYIENGTGDLVVKNNGTESFRIDSSARLNIATTGWSGTSGGLLVDKTTNNVAQLYFSRPSAFTSTQNVIGNYHNGTYIGGINTSTTGTSFPTSSDYRLKENVVSLSNGITRLKELKPYRFNFKIEPSKTVDGFFAHEVTSVVPEAVEGEKDGERMQALDHSKLVPLLTAALKELYLKSRP